MIVSYFDVDWVENVEDRKNTYDAHFFIGDCFVGWFSKKKKIYILIYC